MGAKIPMETPLLLEVGCFQGLQTTIKRYNELAVAPILSLSLERERVFFLFFYFFFLPFLFLFCSSSIHRCSFAALMIGLTTTSTFNSTGCT
jgi:hypothetical protein